MGNFRTLYQNMEIKLTLHFSSRPLGGELERASQGLTTILQRALLHDYPGHHCESIMTDDLIVCIRGRSSTRSAE